MGMGKKTTHGNDGKLAPLFLYFSFIQIWKKNVDPK
jgi:hypothetical protein